MLETARGLAALGVDVRFYAPAQPDLFARADLVHLFGVDASHCGLATLLGVAGIPYVLSTVYYPLGALEAVGDRVLGALPGTTRRNLRRLVRGAAALLPNSAAEARALRRVWGPTGTVVPIPNGARWSDAGGEGDGFFDRHLRDRIPRGERFVLSVARIDRRKNTAVLVRAARAIGAYLVLIGGPTGDAAYAARVQAEVGAAGVRVLQLPALAWQDPLLHAAYAEAWVHALVSSFETPGLANLEAAAQGANLVVGDCPPVREYLTGLAEVCRGADERSVAAGLRAALSQPRDFHGQRETVRQRYPWSRAAEETLSVYEAVAAGRAAAGGQS